MTIDWKNLNTEIKANLHELNIIIARRVGYTVYHYNDLNPYFVLWDKDGNRAGDEHETEGAAWADVPKYSTSLDEAIELSYLLNGNILFMFDNFASSRGGVAHIATIQMESDPFLENEEYTAFGDSYAEAFCKVWLMWDDAMRVALKKHSD